MQAVLTLHTQTADKALRRIKKLHEVCVMVDEHGKESVSGNCQSTCIIRSVGNFCTAKSLRDFTFHLKRTTVSIFILFKSSTFFFSVSLFYDTVHRLKWDYALRLSMYKLKPTQQFKAISANISSIFLAKRKLGFYYNDGRIFFPFSSS